MAGYDIEVKVNKPANTGDELMEWNSLFEPGRAARAYLKNNAPCVQFTQPFNTQTGTLTLTSPFTNGNIPPPGDLSDFGAYLFTGAVTKQGDGYLLTLEIQASCSRKVIASSSIPFDPSKGNASSSEATPVPGSSGSTSPAGTTTTTSGTTGSSTTNSFGQSSSGQNTVSSGTTTTGTSPAGTTTTTSGGGSSSTTNSFGQTSSGQNTITSGTTTTGTSPAGTTTTTSGSGSSSTTNTSGESSSSQNTTTSGTTTTSTSQASPAGTTPANPTGPGAPGNTTSDENSSDENTTSSSAYLRMIGEKAAALLSPLDVIIRKYETAEKEKNKALTLYQTNWEEPAKVTVEKNTLKAGESTPFSISLKDCDGLPVAGREITFNNITFAGNEMPGSEGGSVTPAKVVTDANGIAKATFTLKPGAKEGIIRAYSPGFDVKGCPSLLTGDAIVNYKPKVSGYVIYSYDKKDQCTKTTSSQVSNSVSTWSGNMQINYFATFYLNDQGFNTINTDPEPLDKISQRGRYKNHHQSHAVMKVNGTEPNVTETSIKEDGKFQGAALRYTASKENPYVELNLKFLNNRQTSFIQTYLPPANNTLSEPFDHSIAAFNYDGKLKYSSVKSGSRTTHTFEYINDLNFECTGSKEKLKLVVIEE